MSFLKPPSERWNHGHIRTLKEIVLTGTAGDRQSRNGKLRERPVRTDHKAQNGSVLEASQHFGGQQLTSKLHELALQLGNAANGERFICGCYQLLDCPAVRKFVGLNAIAAHNNNEDRVVSFSEKIFQSDRSAFRCMRVPLISI